MTGVCTPIEPRDQAIPHLDNPGDDLATVLGPGAEVDLDSEAFVAAASRAGRRLAPAVRHALRDFAHDPPPAGALVVHGLAPGRVGPTPTSPTGATDKDRVSELVLLAAASRLGQPVGYAPEHGGRLVQNLLPTRHDAGRQTSTSSQVTLAFHTETAFHPHKPRYLLLLCLRGEPGALTLLASRDAVLDELAPEIRRVLAQPRFRTRADESFLRIGRPATTGADRADPQPAVVRPRLTEPMAVLSGPASSPAFTFDADLMVGLDPEADRALDQVRQAVADRQVGVGLEAGDLLVVDNARAVHGRSPFPARYDGTDRWLQRAFVVTDLAPSVAERQGRVITTRFA